VLARKVWAGAASFRAQVRSPRRRRDDLFERWEQARSEARRLQLAASQVRRMSQAAKQRSEEVLARLSEPPVSTLDARRGRAPHD
jgi:hypothetical protein